MQANSAVAWVHRLGLGSRRLGRVWIYTKSPGRGRGQ